MNRRVYVETRLHGLDTCCLGFTSSVVARRARLASGWLLVFSRQGVEPCESLRKVSTSSTSSFPFPRLCLLLAGRMREVILQGVGFSRTRPERRWRSSAEAVPRPVEMLKPLSRARSPPCPPPPPLRPPPPPRRRAACRAPRDRRAGRAPPPCRSCECWRCRRADRRRGERGPPLCPRPPGVRVRSPKTILQKSAPSFSRRAAQRDSARDRYDRAWPARPTPWCCVQALRWEHLDLVAGTLTVSEQTRHGITGTPKGGRRRVVPMTATLIAALRALSVVRVGYVARNLDGSQLTDGQTTHAIRRIIRRAGLPERGWQTLRHSFGTHAALLGVNAWRLQAWMGHGRIHETMIYVHVASVHHRPLPDALRPPRARTTPIVGSCF